MKTTPVILTTAIISAASLLFTTTSGQAEIRSFSGGASTSGSNNWSNAGNWSGGVAPVEGDILFFVGGSGKRNSTINDYAAGTSFGGITFASTALVSYGLQFGNALTVTGDINSDNSFANSISLNVGVGNSDVSFNVASSGSLTISGTISSTYGLTKTGGGTLFLTRANQISGDIVIDGGTISAAASHTLGTGNAITINNGTLDHNVASTTTYNFSSLTGSTNALITNTFTSSTNRLMTVIVNSTTDSLYEGNIVDGTINGVFLNKQGTGTLTLSGLLRGSTSTQVNGGVLQIGDGGTTGTIEANIVNQGVVAFNRSDETTYAHNMTGAAGRLRQLGSGTLILTGSNSYSRGTDLVNGTIVLGSSNAITTGGTGSLTFTGGILKHTSENTKDYSAKIASIDAGKQARIDTGGQSITYATALKGDGGLEKRGAGSLTLSAVNTFTGATNVSAGTLLVNGSLASSSSVNVGTGAFLAGRGTVSTIEGAGTVGDGIGTILTASSIDGSAGLDFAFKFTNTIPTFNNATASGNDLIRLTGANPFASALNENNTVTLDFSALSLEMGDSVLGGFYTNTDTLSSLEDARYAFVGLGSGYGINVSMIQHLANFTGGSVNGYITQFTVVAIPEPTSIALVLVGGGLVASGVLRRKKVA